MDKSYAELLNENKDLLVEVSRLSGIINASITTMLEHRRGTWASRPMPPLDRAERERLINGSWTVWLMEYKSQVTRQYHQPDGTPLFKPEAIGVWNYGRAFVQDHRVGHHLLARWNDQPPWRYELVKMEKVPFGDVVPRGALIWTSVHDYWEHKG